MINTHQMNILKSKSLDAFQIASRVNRIGTAEGAAILMQSGLILTGYTQPEGNDAATDALRAIDCKDTHRMDDITIVAAMIVTQDGSIDPSTLERLDYYPKNENSQLIRGKAPPNTSYETACVLSMTPL